MRRVIFPISKQAGTNAIQYPDAISLFRNTEPDGQGSLILRTLLDDSQILRQSSVWLQATLDAASLMFTLDHSRRTPSGGAASVGSKVWPHSPPSSLE